MRTLPHSTSLVVASFALALTTVTTLSGCAQHDTLDDEAIAREVRTLESLSAEGAFVCDELRAGHLKASFGYVHIDALLRDALKSRTELAKPSANMLEVQHARARRLADQLVERLQGMASLRPAQGLQEQQQAMLRLKAELDSLEQTL
jgi:hypothetical protein